MSTPVRRLHLLMVLLAVFTVSSSLLYASEPVQLFDGQTLAGWEGNPDWWEVRDGKIVGGSNQKDIPHNTFLMTEESYQNFELVLHIRLYGKADRPNSGIQVRSARIPDSSEVEGYQVDVGDGYWGKLYDEKRRGWLVGTGNNTIQKGKKAANSTGWNKYRIRCQGPTISAWINGRKMFEYTEEDENIPLNGKIGIQVHSGGPSIVEVKKAVIKPLPPTEGVPTWPKDRLALEKTDHIHQRKQAQPLTEEELKSAVGLGKQAGIEQEPKTPSEQKEAFILPDGFDIELVAAETDEVGKFIDVTWDTAGRMWTMTGMEYPVSTGWSEPSERVYKLFQTGGRDRVVVYPNPYGSGPHKYRTFVDGLVQPLGILPFRGGVFVQYGQDIRYYRDRNGDGRADGFETFLTGFGIHDSHLFPHRFKYAPGGWIYTGQGQFNKSTVHRPGNKPFADGTNEKVFNNTKLARFRPDGSNFEIQTWGPSNIWGHIRSRQGQQFIQDANDRGIPVTPFEPAAIYPGEKGKSKPYAPQQPSSFDSNIMGGTGLSGLALADDRGKDGWPVPWGQSTKKTKRFLIVNPMNSRIQRITAKWNGTHYEYEKKSPLLASRDAWFRPVAAHFGPDGALYVVDWYNKIISHNEISIDHPARDKNRGRIWRISHEDQPRDGAPDLTEVSNQELITYLGHNHTRLSRLAWQEVHQRGDQSLVPKLRKIIRSGDTSYGRTFAALWALEGLTTPSEDLLVSLLNAENGNLRTEAVRIIDEHGLLSNRILVELQSHVNDSYHRVRAAIGNLLRRRTDEMTPDLIRIALRLGGSAATSGNEWERYYGHFERYLARWALEGNHSDIKKLTAETDGSPSVSPSARAFVGVLLNSPEGAKRIARAASELDRPLTDAEFSLLAEHFQQPDVRKTAVSLLQNEAEQDRVLSMLTDMNPENVTKELRSAVQAEIQKILASDPDANDWKRVTKLAGTFRLTELAPTIKQRLRSKNLDAESKTAGIKALKQIAPDEVEVFGQLSESTHGSVRREALLALAASDVPEAFDRVIEQLQGASMSMRTLVLNRLASSKRHAPKLVQAALNNRVSGLDGDVLNRLQSVLGKDHDGLARLREQVKQQTRAVLKVGKDGDGYAKADITIEGAFTVEAWVKLIPPITNRHHLVGATDGASDFNFHTSKFRVHNGDKDVIVAETKVEPRTWTHVAVTRNDRGQFTIYMNGERDAQGSGKANRVFKNLQVGTGRVDGAEAYYTEFRVWSEKRTGKLIRNNLLNTFRDSSSRPSTLTHYYYGDHWPERVGNAEIVRESDVPDLKVETRDSEKFQQYLSLANQTGNADHGQKIFQNRCSTCHTTGGADKKVGPSLQGIAHSGATALLNSVLYPDASIQSGYRQFRVKTTDGNLVTGVKTGESEESVTVQLISGDTKRIQRSRIQSAEYANSSLMPKGLLNGLSDKQVRDLFTYLETLK